MKTYGPAFRLILAATMIMPQWSGAQTPKAATAQASSATSATTVTQVGVDHVGQQTIVRVQGAGALSYHVTQLSDPPRVVVDLGGARLTETRNTIASDHAPVRRVRLGQSHPDQVRVVIDLDNAVKFDVERKDQTLVVAFNDQSQSSGISAVALAAKPAVERDSAEAKSSIPHSAGQQSFRLPSTLSGNAALASPLPQTLSAAAVPNPASPKAAQVSVVPAVANTSQPPVAQPVAAPVKAFSGEAISVNLKDVDLKDFFRLIHEISGLNVVLDPAVRGNVTLVLDEVPWDQALDIVLRNNGLSKELDGNVLRIASRDTLKREADEKRDLTKAEAEAVDPITVTRIMNYAKPTELVIPLKRFLSSRGDVMAIDRSNTLIIRDIPSVMPQVDNLIRQLDRRSQQVEIQARVVQASRSFARDIGTQFGIAGFNATPNSANLFAGNPVATQGSPLIHQPAPPIVVGTPASGAGSSGAIPLNVNLPAVAPTSGFLFSRVSPNYTLDFIITASESKGVGKLLSSPQLVTQNNAQAVVKQGTKIPIQTTINNTISVQYIDAVLQLQVTPQITADGNIFMDVLVENTQIDNGIPLVNGIPALDTQSAQTKVMVGDGGTVVIGGVMVSQQQTNIFQVPLFGNIPLIGHLFKETSVKVSSQELLFFLTPRLIPG
jgi:type IV pilus secretin PilQ/predicted competence protein